MNTLIKSKAFWVATAIFLLETLAIIWLALPPALSAIQNTRSQLSDIDSQIAAQQTRVDAGKALKQNSDEVETLFEKATLALPKTTDLDQLMLQLEGLLASLKLDATLSLPLQTSASSSAAASTPIVTSEESSARPGGVGTTTASTPTESNEKTTFTITGKYGFADTRRLLVALKSFSRWNKITSVALSVNGDSSSSTVTAEVFYLAASPAEYFDTAAELIKQAKQSLASLVSYATTPSVETEGNFGRSDPFASP